MGAGRRGGGCRNCIGVGGTPGFWHLDVLLDSLGTSAQSIGPVTRLGVSTLAALISYGDVVHGDACVWGCFCFGIERGIRGCTAGVASPNSSIHIIISLDGLLAGRERERKILYMGLNFLTWNQSLTRAPGTHMGVHGRSVTSVWGGLGAGYLRELQHGAGVPAAGVDALVGWLQLKGFGAWTGINVSSPCVYLSICLSCLRSCVDLLPPCCKAHM